MSSNARNVIFLISLRWKFDHYSTPLIPHFLLPLNPRANALDLSTVQALNMFSVCGGVVERGVQITLTMTQHGEQSEDFIKAHV